MTYVYAWFASGFAYTTVCLFEKNFRKRYDQISTSHQTTTLVILTLLGPISTLMELVAIVRGVCKWAKAKYHNRIIQKTNAEIIESTLDLIEHLKENVHVKCECGHASKPKYFDTDDGGCDATWQCPECGKSAPNVRTE